MRLTSKKIGLLIIEIILMIVIGILIEDWRAYYSFIGEYLPMIGIVMIALVGMGVIVYKKFDEINIDLKKKEDKQKELEKDIQRIYSLVDIGAENKYLKDEIFRIKEMMGNGS